MYQHNDSEMNTFFNLLAFFLQKQAHFRLLSVLNDNKPLTTKRRRTMSYKKGVIGFAIVVSICAVFGSSPLNLAQSAEQTYDVDACVSMEFSSPLVRSQEMTIVNIEAKGIMRSNSENNVFDNCTVDTKGVVMIEGKNMTVHAYMKYLDPDGDYVIFLYTQNAGEKAATTTILAGTGKYKGITGGGKAVRITRGKPVAPGTSQFCNNHKGTFTVP
jgi:hypothetical protein